MAGGINLSLVVNTRDAIREFAHTGESIDKVAGALEGVATESATTGRSLETDIKTAGQTVEREAADMERSFRDAFRTAAKESKDTSRDIDRNTKSGFDAAGDYTGEFKDEARSNFSEITSSFTGDMDSIADLAQGTLGGLAGSLAGPFGIAAGVVAAAGGLFYAKWKENAEKTEARISSMYDDMLESGSNFLSQEFIQQNLQDIYGKTEDAVIGWDRLEEMVRRTGATQEEVALAYAGDATAQKELLDQIAQKRAEVYAKWESASVDQKEYIGGEISVLDQYTDRVTALGEETDDAAARANGYRDAVQRLNTELYQIPEDIRSKVTVNYDDTVARAKLDGFISDVEARRITLTVDARLTDHGRNIA